MRSAGERVETTALVFDGVRRGRTGSWTVEHPPENVLVQVEACALCQRERLVWEGLLERRFPDVLGHEVVGRVLRAPPGSPHARGDRVAGMGLAGLAGVMSVPGWQLAGVPDRDDPHDSLVEPLMCALNAVEQDVPAPATALVLGLGLLGQLLVRVLGPRGIGVVAVDRDRERLAHAREAGARTLAADAPELPAEIAAADSVYECTGAAAPLLLASHHVRPGGSLLLVGHHHAAGVSAGELLSTWHVRGVRVVNAVPRTSRNLPWCLAAAGELVRGGRVRLDEFGIRCAPLDAAEPLLSDWPEGRTYRNVVLLA